MGQPQDGLQHTQQGAPRGLGLVLLLALERTLGEFHIPVAEVVPDELVDLFGGEVEPVGREVLVNLVFGPLQPGDDPTVDEGEVQGPIGAAVACADGEPAVLALGVHEHEAGGIPELVAEVSIALAAREVEVDVAAGCCEAGEGESQGVGAVGRDALGKLGPCLLLDLRGLLGIHEACGALGHQGIDLNAIDEVDGVEGVALALAHLLAFAIANQGMDIDISEGHLSREVGGHHDHASHPEEDDVKARDQHARGQELGESRLEVGPSVLPFLARHDQRGEGHQGRGEPGVEHVGVSYEGA